MQFFWKKYKIVCVEYENAKQLKLQQCLFSKKLVMFAVAIKDYTRNGQSYVYVKVHHISMLLRLNLP